MTVSEAHSPSDDGEDGLSYELKVIGGATGLVLLNALLMYLFVLTPLADINAALFTVPVVGVIVYGLFLVAGEWYAEKSLKSDNMVGAILGVSLLQVTYAAFGSGILAHVPRDLHLQALAVTAVVTAGLTGLLATYIYLRSSDFDHWGKYANVAFLGGLGLAAIGSFVAPVLLFAFVSILLGFILKLGWEIWYVREEYHDVDVAVLGIYVAATGVFVHILQMVARMFLSE